jgi:hypothetical protein
MKNTNRKLALGVIVVTTTEILDHLKELVTGNCFRACYWPQ